MLQLEPLNVSKDCICDFFVVRMKGIVVFQLILSFISNCYKRSIDPLIFCTVCQCSSASNLTQGCPSLFICIVVTCGIFQVVIVDLTLVLYIIPGCINYLKIDIDGGRFSGRLRVLVPMCIQRHARGSIVPSNASICRNIRYLCSSGSLSIPTSEAVTVSDGITIIGQ